MPLRLCFTMVGALWPSALRRVYIAWMAAVFPLGWAVSQLVMAAAYFLVIAPLAIVLRLGGHDPLARRRRSCESYWSEKQAASDATSWFRQY
jgi:hypothetical protein